MCLAAKKIYGYKYIYVYMFPTEKWFFCNKTHEGPLLINFPPSPTLCSGLSPPKHTHTHTLPLSILFLSTFHPNCNHWKLSNGADRALASSSPPTFLSFTSFLSLTEQTCMRKPHFLAAFVMFPLRKTIHHLYSILLDLFVYCYTWRAESVSHSLCHQLIRWVKKNFTHACVISSSMMQPSMWQLLYRVFCHMAFCTIGDALTTWNQPRLPHVVTLLVVEVFWNSKINIPNSFPYIDINKFSINIVSYVNWFKYCSHVLRTNWRFNKSPS